MFAVTVTFTVKPGRMSAFLPLMISNAKSSLSEEEGCHQFDVATDSQRPDEVFLYELYSDAAAFELHLASDHFLSFSAATGDMLADKTVKTYETVSQ